MKAKKALSVLLILCLLFALAPAAFAADDFDTPVSAVDQDKEVGNVTVDDDWYAIWVYASSEDASMTVQGNIENIYDGDVEAAEVRAEDGLTATLTVNGNVNAAGVDEVAAVIANPESGGTSVIEVNGNVTAISEDDDAVGVYCKNEGVNNITVNGSVTATAGDDAYGVYSDGDSVDTVTINGDVSATGPWAYGIGACVGAGDNAYTVTGNVTASAEKYSDGAWFDIYNNCSATLTVGGDVKGDDTGLYIYCEGGSSFQATVLGEVSGADAIWVEDGKADNIDLTLWKASVNPETGTVVAGGAGVDVAAIEQAIQYIILVDPDSADAATLGGTTKSGDYNVAREGDAVYVTLGAIKDGYELRGVYGDKGETVLLQQDANGNYTLLVPKGGGVYFKVLISPLAFIREEVGSVSFTVDGESFTIRFCKNGTFDLLDSSGKIVERGYFRMVNGVLTVFNRRNMAMPVNENGTFTYIFASDITRTVEITLPQATLNALTGK